MITQLLDARLKNVEEITKNVKKDIEKLTEACAKWEQKSGDVSNLSKAVNVHQKSLQAMYEKERETHIIATGIPESNADQDFISEILTKIGCPDVAPIKITRLGQQRENNPHPRPILIVLNNVADRTRILDGAKILKSSGDSFSNIFLKKDIHPDVRKEWKWLRDVCRTEKNKSANQGTSIYVDYKQGVLKRDNVIIDQYANPFRAAPLGPSK